MTATIIGMKYGHSSLCKLVEPEQTNFAAIAEGETIEISKQGAVAYLLDVQSCQVLHSCTMTAKWYLPSISNFCLLYNWHKKPEKYRIWWMHILDHSTWATSTIQYPRTLWPFGAGYVGSFDVVIRDTSNLVGPEQKFQIWDRRILAELPKEYYAVQRVGPEGKFIVSYRVGAYWSIHGQTMQLSRAF